MNDEAEDRDENAGVRDIEGRPGMRERHMQIEQCEIDDVAVEKAVGQVAHDSAEEQSERDTAQGIARSRTPQKQRENDNEGDAVILAILFFYLPEPQVGTESPLP